MPPPAQRKGVQYRWTDTELDDAEKVHAIQCFRAHQPNPQLMCPFKRQLQAARQGLWDNPYRGTALNMYCLRARRLVEELGSINRVEHILKIVFGRTPL